MTSADIGCQGGGTKLPTSANLWIHPLKIFGGPAIKNIQHLCDYSPSENHTQAVTTTTLTSPRLNPNFLRDMVSIFENPLATPEQLATSPSQADGIPEDLEIRIRVAGCRLLQAAGILLKLPQTTIATAIVLLQRFYLIASMRQYSIKDASQASLFLSSKLTEHPQRPRDIVNVYAYLLSSSSSLTPPSPPSSAQDTNESETNPDNYYVTEGYYYTARTNILNLETLILRSLGFHTHVALPYTLAFNYLQSFNALHHESEVITPPDTAGKEGDTAAAANGSDRAGSNVANLQPRQHAMLASTTFAYLTDFLLSPSQPYLTHQPHELAVAAVYLAARDHSVKLPEAWWEVWDVEREVLGFLVVVGRGGTYNVGGSNTGGKKVYITDDNGTTGDGSGEEGGGGKRDVVPVGPEGLERELQRRRAELLRD